VSNPAKPFPAGVVNKRANEAAASGAAKLVDQCSTHKSKYLRARASSASASSFESLTPESTFFCAAK
jgi:hypothetical protein